MVAGRGAGRALLDRRAQPHRRARRRSWRGACATSKPARARRARSPARRRTRCARAQARIAQLEARLAESQSQQLALEALYQDLSRNRDEWQLAEIEQVLAIASQQLQLAGNVRAALLALQLAEARLARADRPQFVPVRRALARDIERLRALPAVDLPAMSVRLDTPGRGGRLAAARLRRARRAAGAGEGRAGRRAERGVLARLGAEVWNELQPAGGGAAGRTAPSRRCCRRRRPTSCARTCACGCSTRGCRCSRATRRATARTCAPRRPGSSATSTRARARRVDALAQLKQLSSATRSASRCRPSPTASTRCAASSRGASARRDEIALLAARGVRGGASRWSSSAGSSAGYVLFVYPPWRVEMSMLFFAVALLAAVRRALRAGHAAARPRAGAARARCAPIAPGAAASARTTRFAAALQAYYEGRYARAEKEAALAFEDGADAPASRRCSRRAPRTRCATSSGARPLARARGAPPASRLQTAQLVSRAELALDERDFIARARRAAQPARQRAAAHRQHAHAAARRARRRRLGRGAAPRRRSSPSATRSRRRSPRNTSCRRRSSCSARSADDAAPSSGAGARIARRRTSVQPRVAAAAARHATTLGNAALARAILEQRARRPNGARRWCRSTASCRAGSTQRGAQPRRARASSAPSAGCASAAATPQLLATLGRLCAEAELWGKARSFLEASLSFEESRAAHLELARLAERLGRRAGRAAPLPARRRSCAAQTQSRGLRKSV